MTDVSVQGISSVFDTSTLMHLQHGSNQLRRITGENGSVTPSLSAPTARKITRSMGCFTKMRVFDRLAF